MKILLTGASGFLGEYIYDSLPYHQIITLGRSVKNDIVLDLATQIPKVVDKLDLIIHAAGKAHFVPKSDNDKKEFYDINVNGTINLLKGFVDAPPKYFCFISSVSVYGREEGLEICEDSSILAADAYGKSKIDAELIVQNWCDQNNVICTILRLPLIAGKNPPGNLGAMIKGIKNGYYLNIGGGKAKKSIVLADDVAKIIIPAAKVGGIYNLTDGYNPSFNELSEYIAKQLGKSKPLNIPFNLAKLFCVIGNLLGSRSPINSNKLKKITSNLTFSDNKARKQLNWNPSQVLNRFTI